MLMLVGPLARALARRLCWLACPHSTRYANEIFGAKPTSYIHMLAFGGREHGKATSGILCLGYVPGYIDECESGSVVGFTRWF